MLRHMFHLMLVLLTVSNGSMARAFDLFEEGLDWSSTRPDMSVLVLYGCNSLTRTVETQQTVSLATGGTTTTTVRKEHPVELYVWVKVDGRSFGWLKDHAWMAIEVPPGVHELSMTRCPDYRFSPQGLETVVTIELTERWMPLWITDTNVLPDLLVPENEPKTWDNTWAVALAMDPRVAELRASMVSSKETRWPTMYSKERALDSEGPSVEAQVRQESRLSTPLRESFPVSCYGFWNGSRHGSGGILQIHGDTLLFDAGLAQGSGLSDKLMRMRQNSMKAANLMLLPEQIRWLDAPSPTQLQLCFVAEDGQDGLVTFDRNAFMDDLIRTSGSSRIDMWHWDVNKTHQDWQGLQEWNRFVQERLQMRVEPAQTDDATASTSKNKKNKKHKKKKDWTGPLETETLKSVWPPRS
ncbi:MAG: hypothetical protein KDC10_12260 [Calditrichaeota bacterium]|nr:hypothetical protein [Calditrichota bacterium]